MLSGAMSQLPSGTVTFVFSDIEGSTALLKQLGDEAYAAVLGRHRQLVREASAAHNGLEIDTQGDAFFYSFSRARDAVAAAVDIQRLHAAEEWPPGVAVRVRLGLHTGEPAVGDEGYTGLDVVRAARIAAVARGGQVLLSATTRALVGDALPDGVTLRSAGERALKDIERPEPLHELRIAGLPADDLPTPVIAQPPLAAEGPASAAALDAALEQEGVPEWVRDTARRFVPALPDTAQLIEERVVGRLEEAFREKRAERERRALARHETRSRQRASTRSGRQPAVTDRPSLADEIAKLQALRDAGALSDEQYERAVERAIRGGD
jgi:class 3 adenylate cyclase